MQTQPTIAEIGEERRERFRADARRNWLRVAKPQTLDEVDAIREDSCEKNS